MKILYRVPQWILWNVLSRTMVALLIKPFYRFCTTPDSDPLPAAPFVIVANHGTFFDPWMVGYFSRSPLNFMTNEDAFRAPRIVRWYLRSIGAFPKKKGGSDYKAMKETLRRLTAGAPVCIFPEGQTTWDGETQLIYKGIEKIIKRARCPLVMVRIRGNFLTRPWWARSRRTGRIFLNFTTLSVADIARLSDDDLFDTIRRNIHQDDVKDTQNRSVPFRGRNMAAGLERFVWQCRNCKAEDRLETQGNTIRCSACGASWSMDARCRFFPVQKDIAAPGDLKDWFAWLKVNVREKIGSVSPKDILTAGENIALLTLAADKRVFLQRGTGRLELSSAALTFIPAGGGEPRVFDVDRLQEVVFQKQELFEFVYGGDLFRFHVPDHSPMKWVVYLRYLTGYSAAEERGYL